MLVTLFGIVMLARPSQLLKAKPPMLVTLLGMVVFLQPAISVFVAVSIIALQPLRLSYTVLPLSTFMLARLRQSLNAWYPMLVTLFGMVMLARLVQLVNAWYPMLVTLFGIVMLARPVQ